MVDEINDLSHEGVSIVKRYCICKKWKKKWKSYPYSSGFQHFYWYGTPELNRAQRFKRIIIFYIDRII